jgi:hypothetical protein
MSTAIQVVLNPFLGTFDEHLGWALVNKIIEVDNSTDTQNSAGFVWKGKNIPDWSYRQLQVADTEFKIGDVVYVNGNSKYAAKVLSCLSVGLSCVDESAAGTSSVFVQVQNLRTKQVQYVKPSTLERLINVSDLSSLVGVRSTDNRRVIVQITQSGVHVLDTATQRVLGYRTTTLGGLYECFEGLRKDGFPVYLKQTKTRKILGLDKLQQICGTLNLKLLLNHNEETSSWQLEDTNGVRFDFTEYMNAIQYEYIDFI